MKRVYDERKCSSSLHASPRLYDKQFPFFREPAEIGTFSLDEKKQFHNDGRQLRKYVPPATQDSCYFDLRHGYSKMIKKDENLQEYIDTLLCWVMESKHRFYVSPKHVSDGSTDRSSHRFGGKRNGPNGNESCNPCVTNPNLSQEKLPVFKSLNTDFLCWRGLLTRLLCVPYQNREDLLIAIIKFRGTYFLCEFDTEAKKCQKQQTTPREEEMCAWGFKFEQYVTSDINMDQPDTSQPVNTNAAFCSVARSRLQSHSLVYGGEVDCIDFDCNYKNKYVELKTSRIMDNQRQQENFCRFKLIKWWAQSFLIGIPRVVCGFRDDHGVVRHLKEYPVKDMPTLAREKARQPWKPTVCFNFLDTVLNFIKSNVREDNERVVYLLRWQPGSDMTLEFAGKDSQYHFLPDWFLHWDAWDKPFC